MSPRTVASYCRICAAACGILVTVDEDERVTKVRGDPDHPGSRGYVCPKGRGLAAFHHRADRLDDPRVDGTATTWDRALDDLASRLGTIRAAGDPDAIGLYLATGLAYDAAGQLAAPTWLAMLGSRSFYTAVTVDNAPVLVAAELVAGHPMLNPVWDPTSPGVLVLVGTNPVVSHGYGTTLPDPIGHLRDYRARGGRVWVIDPRRSETAAHADGHLAVRPGSDALLLAAIARAVLADVQAGPIALPACRAQDLEALQEVLAPCTEARAAEAAGVEPADVRRLVADVRAARGRVAMQCGTGTTMAADGVLTEWLRWVILALSDSLDRPGGMRFQDGPFGRLRALGGPPPDEGPRSRPDLPRVARQHPAVALVDEIEAGHLRALVITGGNPITAFPEPERVRAALARLEVLAVVDVVDGELAGLATHVLPATGQLERADVTLSAPLSVRSAVQATRPVVAPGGQRRPAWWIVAELARRMDLTLVAGADPGTLDDEGFLRVHLQRSPVDVDAVFAAGPHGLPLPVETGWVAASLLPDGCWNLAPPELVARLAGHQPTTAPLVLAPRREMGWSNSVRYGGADVAVARMHPDDARSAGVAGGDAMSVRSAHGEVRVAVELDAAVRPGVVSVTHGHRDASPGTLTSGTTDVDPLTAMPRATGVPVTLDRPDP